MSARALWLIAVAGCGRVGFDAVTDADTDILRGPPPVARYLLDDDPDDGVADSTGHGHTGTCSPCPPRTSAIDGEGYLFDGEVIRIAASPAPATGDFSVAAWVRPEIGDLMCFANKLAAIPGDNSWQLCITNTSALVACVGDSAMCAFSARDRFATSAWRHVTLSVTARRMRAWVGGERVIDAAANPAVGDFEVVIGADIDNGAVAAPFLGVIDDVRIWDLALTDAEVAVIVAP